MDITAKEEIILYVGVILFIVAIILAYFMFRDDKNIDQLIEIEIENTIKNINTILNSRRPDYV